VRIALQKDLSSIFLWGNSDLYFRAIEFSLLLQCVYIALWCTNFALVAAEADDSVKWELFLLIPIPLNFLLLKLILNFACVLRSASVLDEEIAVKICEEAIDERVVTQRLRKMVRTSLLDIEPVKSNWSLFLTEVFAHYVPDNRPGLSTKQFSLFLHGIQIHLSKKSIQRIFKVIDFDHSGYITWTEFSSIVFPELFGPLPMSSERADSATNLPLMHMESIHTAPAGTDGMYHPVSSTNIARLRQMSIDEDDVFELDPELDSNYHADPGSPRTSDPLSQKSENISNWGRSPRRNGSRDQGETRSRVVSFSEPQRERDQRERDQRERSVSLSPPIDRSVTFQDEKEIRDHVHVHSLQPPTEEYDDTNDSEDGLEVTDDAEEVAAAHADDEEDEEDRIMHLEKIDEEDEAEEEED
jgi:Ca2+-binding EF-hand superfamily protein